MFSSREDCPANGSRPLFFAGSAFTADQDGRGRGRNLGNQSRDFLHLQVVADDELTFRALFEFAQRERVLILERLRLILVSGNSERNRAVLPPTTSVLWGRRR